MTDIKLIWGHVGLMLGPLLGHVGPGLGYLEAMSGNFWAKDFALKKMSSAKKKGLKWPTLS